VLSISTNIVALVTMYCAVLKQSCILCSTLIALLHAAGAVYYKQLLTKCVIAVVDLSHF